MVAGANIWARYGILKNNFQFSERRISIHLQCETQTISYAWKILYKDHRGYVAITYTSSVKSVKGWVTSRLKLRKLYLLEVRQEEVNKVHGIHLTDKWLQIIKEQLTKTNITQKLTKLDPLSVVFQTREEKRDIRPFRPIFKVLSFQSFKFPFEFRDSVGDLTQNPSDEIKLPVNGLHSP